MGQIGKSTTKMDELCIFCFQKLARIDYYIFLALGHEQNDRSKNTDIWK